MDTETHSVTSKRSWISEHPRVVIGIILVLCLGPFVNKAIHTDDALYVWTGQWIQKHPADFFGFKVNEWVSAIPMWAANWNPPLMSYFLAGAASLFGWSEIALHLACLAVAFMAAMGIYSLAQLWCGRPLLATLVAIFTPAFLVSSTTLMCDVLMLTFWIWALVLWERALASGRGRWRFVGAGVLAGLAVLTKYSAITMLPLFAILGVLRIRRAGWWVMGVVAPLIIVAGYEWMTTKMYGTGLFFAAVGHTHHSREFPGSWGARGIIGLAFAGGCLLPLLFFAPFLWRAKTLLAGGIVILGMWLALFPLWDRLQLVNGVDPEMVKHWNYLLQVALLVAGGLHLLLLTATEVWQKRDINSIVLAFWVISGLFSATVLNFAINARSFLLIVPPAAILLARRLEATRGSFVAGSRWLWPLAPAAVVSLSMVIADYELANSSRSAAEQIMAKYKSADRTVWFEGHGAFQYYMEKLGGTPVDVEQSVLQPGDIAVVPWLTGGFITFPTGSLTWGESLMYKPHSWMNLMGASESGAAGFYGANWGPVPFALGGFPPQAYFVVKVFSRLKFHSQPANSQVVRTGEVPRFPNISVSMDDTTIHHENMKTVEKIRQARELEREGKIEEAIQYYREVLNVDANSSVALNNLAWILATANRTGLRNGEEAVRLASRAYEVTGGTQPVIITTLAAAYAQAGQFSDAIRMARVAHHLSILMGQSDVAELNIKLLSAYSAGRPIELQNNP